MLVLVALLPCVGGLKARAERAASAVETGGSWFFAVSGDSRDCGDLIMPKIARSIDDHRDEAPVEFYWHLGDLRAIYRVDCDYAKLSHMSMVCDPNNRGSETNKLPATYLDSAWDDFIRHQILPFGTTPFFLGIGNHELITPKAEVVSGQPQMQARDRNSFQKKFGWWLNHPLIVAQRDADRARNIPAPEGETYFHFVRNGVDFIYLDNAGGDASFSPRQLEWLAAILKADAQDPTIKTIIAGMHAALPLSRDHLRWHAMDKSQAGFCSGRRAYELLFAAQNLDAPAEKRKFVYVLASHSHFFETDIYNSAELRAEHAGRVLPGWIIGTAGAVQYVSKDPATGKDVRAIMYGYMEAEVRSDGSLRTKFREVGEKSQPVLTDAWGIEMTNYCFKENKQEPSDDRKNDKPYDCVN